MLSKSIAYAEIMDLQSLSRSNVKFQGLDMRLTGVEDARVVNDMIA